MAIFKKGKTWYIDYCVDGRRKREAIGHSRKVAECALAKRKVQIAENKFLDMRLKQSCGFEQLTSQYLEWARTNKLSCSRDE